MFSSVWISWWDTSSSSLNSFSNESERFCEKSVYTGRGISLEKCVTNRGRMSELYKVFMASKGKRLILFRRPGRCFNLRIRFSILSRSAGFYGALNQNCSQSSPLKVLMDHNTACSPLNQRLPGSRVFFVLDCVSSFSLGKSFGHMFD